MKIVVIGGTGLVGSKVVAKLAAHGHDAVPASPGTGVNTLTGGGLTRALAGADVVVDVSNSPSFEDTAVLEFFETSTRNILGAEAAAGVGHHVALSVVGTERLGESGYLRAKIAQERLIKNSSIPYTIVHATQFFEFAARMADEASDGDTVPLPPALIQPMAADDAAAAVCNVALAAPLNNTIEIAGPEPLQFEDFVREGLRSVGDHIRLPASLLSGCLADTRSGLVGQMPRCYDALCHVGRRRMAAGTGGVFHRLDGAEKGAEDDVVALDIRVGRPFVARHAVGLFFRQAGLGEGQFCPDIKFEFVQEGVIAGRGAHLSSRRDMSECGGRPSC